MPTPPILNIHAVEYTNWSHGEKFAAQLGAIGSRLGAKKLGYRIVVVPPGKSAWPYHLHYVNEEMAFILEGMGTLRYAEHEYPVRAGDVICLPPGPGTPHQILNTSGVELKYLAVSTMEEPEVAEYPDSGKFGVIAGVPPGIDPAKRTLSFFGRKSSAVDYWDGED